MRVTPVKITFLPEGKTVEARKGRTILEIAKQTGVRIQYECDGNCTCGTCSVIVESGMESLSPMTENEKAHLNRLDLSSEHRLSCQSRVMGDIVIRITT